MALAFILAGSVLLIIALSYACIRIQNQSKNSQKALSEQLEIDAQLRNEISELRTKLQFTLNDPVTQLLGWQLFEDRIEQNLKESERYHFTMGVMFVDVDDFKMINDALGDDVGDKVLREMARRLNDCIRQVDSVSRFAKDTFVILLTQLAKPETAAIVGQRILQALSQPFQIDDHELFITACIGVALFPIDGQEAQALLKNANHALQVAKSSGRHLCQFYQNDMHLQSQRDLAIYNKISRDSIFQELVVYYQPIINVNNEAVFCMDASLYWRHAEFGLVNNQTLYDYAEKQRKVTALSMWFLKNACKQFLAWRQAGFQSQLLGLPLSIKQLENSGFVYELSHSLQELAFNPEWLLVEIKESHMHEPLETIEKAFNMLNYLGIKIAIDDFASGSFSLRYLKKVTVNYLKLDTSFAEDIIENEQTRALVKSIVFLADALAIQVIIQGVQGEQQMTAFKKLGCSLLSGPWMGAPRLGLDVINSMTVPSS